MHRPSIWLSQESLTKGQSKKLLRIAFYCQPLLRLSMGKIRKTFALLLTLIIVMSCLTLLSVKPANAQSSNQVPSTQWQKAYGSVVLESSNLIQTSDGGYAFLDLGFLHSVTFRSATIYKVDSGGRLQWQKSILYFLGLNIIQTSDKGYEISGHFQPAVYAFGGGSPSIPPGYQGSIVKMDPCGNIQWIENYTSTPPTLTNASSSIQTSDGGFAYWGGNLAKTDAANNTQWVKALTYFSFGYYLHLTLTSVIETSDGGIAALGVGPVLYSNRYNGIIYLVKIVPFLPKPSPSPLPTPLLSTPLSIRCLLTQLAIPIFAVAVYAVIIISLLIYGRHRKSLKNRSRNI